MITYKTKKDATKNCASDERIIRVDGGYAVITYAQYFVWCKQK